MTNLEMVDFLFNLFKEYFEFMLPVFALLGGFHFIFILFYSFVYRPSKDFMK